jgi:glycosyltransferase involved in cell wall biosynthesis
MPKISIIIPCYNSGAYLPEAIESITNYPREFDYEVIIVNDGSSDEKTIDLLKQLGNTYTVINQENKGPAAARNAGVKAAKTDYLLFLDSDNKIRPNYINLGIELLDTQKEFDILYGNPHFFGDVGNRTFAPQKYDLLKMMEGNFIDMCAIVRKSVWEKLNGFDETKVLIGHEDWDFWIRAGQAGFQFYHIDEILYEYRIREDSLMGEFAESKLMETKSYLYTKHIELIVKAMETHRVERLFNERDKSMPFRTFLKYAYYKYLKKQR